MWQKKPEENQNQQKTSPRIADSKISRMGEVAFSCILQTESRQQAVERRSGYRAD